MLNPELAIAIFGWAVTICVTVLIGVGTYAVTQLLWDYVRSTKDKNKKKG